MLSFLECFTLASLRAAAFLLVALPLAGCPSEPAPPADASEEPTVSAAIAAEEPTSSPEQVGSNAASPEVEPDSNGDPLDGESFPYQWSVLAIEGAEATLATPIDGVMRVEIQRLSGGPGWHIQLVGHLMPLQSGESYFASFRARSDASKMVSIIAQESSGNYANLGLDREFELDTQWRDFGFEFTATKSDEASRLRFILGENDVAVEISGVEFTVRRPL